MNIRGLVYKEHSRRCLTLPNTSTEDLCLYVQVIQPGFVHILFLPSWGVSVSAAISVKLFSHWQTVRIFLLAPNCLSAADSRP